MEGTIVTDDKGGIAAVAETGPHCLLWVIGV